jgi:hypothetical protein
MYSLNPEQKQLFFEWLPLSRHHWRYKPNMAKIGRITPLFAVGTDSALPRTTKTRR